jgi:hypothetical protein
MSSSAHSLASQVPCGRRCFAFAISCSFLE